MSLKILDNQDSKTKEYLAKIGEVIVTFNYLESAIIDFWIWELICAGKNINDIQGIGRRITTLLTFRQKADLLKSLVIEIFGEKKAKLFSKPYKKIIKSSEIRNDVCHSQWFIQYGNLKEGVPMTTHKINLKRGSRKGRKFDFSRAMEDNIDLKCFNGYLKQIEEAIRETLIFFIHI